MMSWLLENIYADGEYIDFLFTFIYYITTATFVLVAVCMSTFFNSLPTKTRRPGYIYPRQQHARNYLDDHAGNCSDCHFVLSHASWAKLKLSPPANPGVRLEVIGKQFNWIAIYPGPVVRGRRQRCCLRLDLPLSFEKRGRDRRDGPAEPLEGQYA